MSPYAGRSRCALSNPGEILVDEATVAAAGREWPWVPIDDLVDLDDQPIAVRSLPVPNVDT